MGAEVGCSGRELLYFPGITLSRGLAPGEYDATMLVQPYRISDLSQTNSANIEFVIVVV